MSNVTRKMILDPIDVVTGECYVERTDFSLPGPIKLDWRTYYTSLLKTDGAMGCGWTYNYNRFLVVENGFCAYIDENASTVPFPAIPEKGESVEGQDNRYILFKEDEGKFRLHLPDKLILSFGNSVRGLLRLEKISNRNGNSITFLYSGDFNLIRIVDSAKRILNLELDNSGHIVSITCSQENNPAVGIRLVSYTYNKNGDLIAVNDANNQTSRYEYDDNHRLTKRTDRNGYSFNYEYLGEKCVRSWGDDGLFRGDMIYSPEKRRTIYKGCDDRIIDYRYNENNLVVEEIDPYDRVTQNAYDDKGNLVSVLDRCGRRVVFGYDDHGNKVEEVDAEGRRTTYAYDDKDQLIEKTEPSGEKTIYNYDDRGNIIKEEKSNGDITINEYDAEGHKILSQSSNQMPKKYVYDQYHQLIGIQFLFGGDINRYRYDMLGNVISVWDGKSWVNHKYDNMSRLIEIEYPDGTIKKNAYDPEGNPISYTDRLGRTWKYRYKARDQLIEIVAPDGSSLKFDYTKADELSEVIDPNGNRTEYLYDMCDYIIGIKRNGNLYESYERDGEGRLICKRDSQGKILMTLAFDVANQPIQRIIERDGKKIEQTYTYDDKGNPITAINEYANVERVYDPSGKIALEKINDKGIINEYDDTGCILRTIFDDGTEFRYKDNGDFIVVRDPSGYWHTFYYDGEKILQKRFANGFDEAYDYDLDMKIISHKI
ncbi:TPA: RHS repeat protein, partial [bacterium]|nr:RHS repeat protein [bacterium]